MKLLVALPCYNEAEKIQKVIQESPSSFEGIDERRILVVDDGSADETASLAHEAGAVVIRHKVNKGLGQTFRDAVEYAVVHGFDIMVNMDGDGQFNSQNIADLIAPILHNEADFVTGSRFMTGRELPHMPPIKRWGNDRMTNLISRLCRRNTTAGAGKVQKDAPDGDECQLVVGDGASLTMWQVAIPVKNAANPTGTFIRYADADGRIYQYDTDQLLFTEIAAILALP